jgi:hypothetical protein
MNRKTPWILSAWLLLAACGDTTGPDPEQKAEDDLTIVRFDAVRFQTAQKSGSFWAVKGDERRLELRYADSSGPGGPEFLEFRVPDDALLRRPDGTTFQEGDSVLITVSVDAGGRFIFDFQPSGLVFNPDDPAELEINFTLADRDFNGDGVIDASDEQLKAQLSIWKQEVTNTPWLKLQTLRVREDEIRADVTGFTGFACAN